MSDRAFRIVFWSLIALCIIDRMILLLRFGFTHTGTDDVVVWEMARDYGRGIFHEPYMYGQNYNPMLEALLGAPFVRMGIAPWIALPLITSLLALAPYWSFALWHHRRGEFSAACLFAAMPLMLPVEWSMLTAMPRGFVHGIAILALLPWMAEAGPERWRHAATMLVLSAAVFFNPNAMVFIVATGVVLVFQHARSRWFWTGSLLGLLPAALAWWAARAFYHDYPHPMHHMIMDWEMEFKPHVLGEAFQRLDSHFQWMMPLWWRNGHVVLWSLVIAVILLWRKHRPRAIGVFSALVFIVLALGFWKVHDGVDSVFYPRSRMFLAVPLLLAWAFAPLLPGAFPRRATVIAALGLAGLLVARAVTMEDRIDRQLADQRGALVREKSVAFVRDRCERIQAAAWEYGADAVITLRWPDVRVDPEPHFLTYFDRYACGILRDGMPLLYGPGYERCAWVIDAIRRRVPHTPLFVGGDPAAWDAIMRDAPRIRRLGDQPLLHLIEGNAEPIDSIVVRGTLAVMR